LISDLALLFLIVDLSLLVPYSACASGFLLWQYLNTYQNWRNSASREFKNFSSGKLFSCRDAISILLEKLKL